MSEITLSSGFTLKPSDSAQLYIKDGWFNEKEVLWPGQKFCLQVKEVILNAKSSFQDIIVFDSTHYGRVLILDGVIQLTERDEHAYQEMIAHIPLFAHACPKRVLIIGAGDGGVLREVCRHACVETIHMCEIDQGVVEVSKEFFSTSTATHFGDNRLTLIFDDAAQFIKTDPRAGNYDVIICDSSDPVGPAESLFEPAFFESMAKVLAPGGVFSTQGECQWLHLDLIKPTLDANRKIFADVKYAFTHIPSYPSGQIGFQIATNDASLDVTQSNGGGSKRPLPEELRFYSPEVHAAAFVLPVFARNALA
jgi:spermidine synthase